MKSEFSHHFSHDWVTQYERMHRWSKRALLALKKNELSEEDLDDIYAFFIAAFSIRDWVKNSSEIQIQDFDQNLHSFKFWGLCRDMANGLKHFELNSPSYDPNFTIWCANTSGNSKIVKEYWYILAGNKLHSMQNVVESTTDFLTKLLKPYKDSNPIIPKLRRENRS